MRILNSILSLLLAISTFAQSPLSSGAFDYHLTDRYEILQDSMTISFFKGIKPYNRQSILKFSQNIKVENAKDQFNKDFLLKDNILFYPNSQLYNRKSILKKFYNTESALFHVKTDRFKLIVNPVLGFAGGNDPDDDLNVYRNSRGAEIKGSIGNKVGFYSYALENQVRFPNYIRRQYDENDVIYGATLTKYFGRNPSIFLM